MRLFDKLIAHGPREFREPLRTLSPVVLAVDQIAKHYAEHEQFLWGSDDYPYARPPWKTSFVEWNLPAMAIVDGQVIRPDPGQSFGALVVSSYGREKVESARKLLESLSKKELAIHPDAEVVCVLQPAFSSRIGIAMGKFQIYWFLRGDGYILNHCPIGYGLIPLAEEIGELEAGRFICDITHVIALAFTFANCSNVKLVDVTEELEPPAKIKRRLKLPSVRRYTLNIAGHVSRPSREAGEGPKGVMPFHLCRGHFATYTPERPLFGKHVGRFWIPPHTKGKRERGEVIKDYAIEG